ncbi:hypothetical protein WX45_01930 [Clostridium ljungdahlii DSM 13528]|uniref:Conserved phage-related protein n=2 Tax=Clostridium ljungdahlii TaxID=1538 RepID=D8GU67_CLOLD|nr:hypothetical protein [Clostridium ljungdahlii]ADK14730.1 conserved phage-related protein [Clostridium ljungdahlii DSM 13528]OAA84086.1 hypothetical protein WX45_01930 [Clostridium ljungdahlii DSM 13528]
MAEDKMYKILRLKLKNCKRMVNKEGKQIGVEIRINENKLRKSMTLVKEPETIRIIKTLAPDRNSEDLNGFTYVKDLITMSVNIDKYRDIIKSNYGLVNIIFTRKPKLNYKKFNSKISSKDFNHISNKSLEKYKYNINIEYKNELFKRLMASSGNVRNKKVVFIREKLFDKTNEILLCGLPEDMEHPAFSKYNSYYAMASTDSIPVTTPNFVVIDDYTRKIEEVFDYVKEKEKVSKKDKDNYEIEEGTEKSKIEITPFDGAGLVDVSLAEQWKKDIGLDYLPSSWQFRAIPGIKGDVYTFDLKKFAKEFKSEIKDVFGQTWDLFKDNINMILTKSQFKFYKQYKANFGEEKAFKTWEDNFYKELHGYKRTFNISKYSEKNLKHEALLSYQPIQSLELSDNDIKNLCSRTVKKIKKISTDVNEFLKYRGVINSQENEIGELICQKRIPPYYKALNENKDLFYDDYIQQKIKDDIKGFKKRTLKGCIFVPGNYQTLIPDVFALAQYAFGLKVTGGLKANTVYSEYWVDEYINFFAKKLNSKKENMKCGYDYNKYLSMKEKLRKLRDGKIKELNMKIDVIRFPHVSNEHFPVTVVNQPNDYYKYMTEGIVTSMYDSLALHIGGADYDNDHVLSTNDQTLVRCSVEQKTNTIVPISLKDQENDDNKMHKITDMDEIIDTDIRGMSNNIGKAVNKITKLWSVVPKDDDEKIKVRRYIKIMSVVCSKIIDFAKTGKAATIPCEIEEYLKDIQKPYFQRYIYNHEVSREKIMNENRELYGEDKKFIFSDTNCVMNRLCHYMEKEIANIDDELKKNKEEQLEEKAEDITCFYSEKNTEQFKDKKYDNSVSYTKYIKPLLKDLKKEYDEISKYNSQENNNIFCSSDIKQEHDDRYKIFYTYAKMELMNILEHKELKLIKEKLLDFIVFAFYRDKDFNKLDKSLLWNCFGSELSCRIKGKSLIVKKSKLTYEDRREKISKLKKINNKKNKIYISIFKNEEKDKQVEIFDSELDVFKNIGNKDERNLLKALYIISKFNKVFKGNFKFEIEKNKKDAITKTHMCKLADIDARKYPNILKKVITKHEDIVTIEPSKDYSKIICEFKKDKFSKNGNSKKYTDINECRSRFK